MFFSKSISVPANTLAAAPQETEIDVAPGVLRRVWVRWRWGIGNLGGCRIERHEFQYFPLTRGQWLPSSEHPLEFEVDMAVEDSPFQFTVQAYNTDDTFPHTLWVAFNVLREGEKPMTAAEVAQVYADLGYSPVGGGV